MIHPAQGETTYRAPAQGGRDLRAELKANAGENKKG
jgi:hypothetical protein